MKSKITRQQLAELGESQFVEFKRSLGHQKEGLESITAMVNADTAKGLVIFGIGPDGSLVGIEPGNVDSAQRTLAEHARSKIDPPMQHNIEVLDCDGLTLIALHAQRKKDVPFHEYDGRVFIREGTSNRRLGFEEKQSLVRSRNRDFHLGPWRCDHCGSFVGMLSCVEITDQGPRKSYRCRCGGEYWPAG
jgi:predicted HTH transcriptional regulator